MRLKTRSAFEKVSQIDESLCVVDRNGRWPTTLAGDQRRGRLQRASCPAEVAQKRDQAPVISLTRPDS
jgi:hypothetical protein